jgi:GH25 family lysozyme M1 (1,4-beta-N-acetylmuramidase)
MVKTYSYDQDVRLTPHFRSSEFRCKCGKKHDYKIDESLPQNLEKLFTVIPELFGIKVKEIRLTSGFRCVKHDKSVGGSGSGPHTGGFAADYCVYDEDGKIISTKLVCCAAQEIGFKGIANIDANYLYIHSDMKDRIWRGNEFLKGNGSIESGDFWTYFGITRKTNAADAEVVVGRGIDVSAWQGDIDFAKAAPEIDFAVIRAGFGRLVSQEDVKFRQNYDGFKAQGTPLGVYWYCYAENAEDAKKEAYACLEVLKGKQFELPIFYDILEDDHIPILKKGAPAGQEQAQVSRLINEIVPAFCSILEQNGYYVGVYCNTAGYTSYLNDSNKQRYVQWVADWRGTCGYTGQKVLWQYSCKGKISGIEGDVDKDYAYTDFAVIKEKGFNGWGKTDDTQPTLPGENTPGGSTTNEPGEPAIKPNTPNPTPDEAENIFEKILKEIQAINAKL